MSTKNNISFDDSKFKIKSRVVLGQEETPKIIKFLVNKKIVKTEKQALIFLLILLIIALSLSVFFTTKSMSTEPARIDPMLISNIK